MCTEIGDVPEIENGYTARVLSFDVQKLNAIDIVQPKGWPEIFFQIIHFNVAQL
jgi:hypothetical protein